MLKNYFKIAVRNISRHKVFAFINIFGLSVGMACTILIMLWVHDELSYDKHHRDADKTYLVLRGDKNGTMALTSKLLAEELKDNLPEVESSAYCTQLPETYKFLIQHGDNGFEENVLLASSNFFDFFSYRFIRGNPSSVLSDPNSVVVTKDIAKKYFGQDDPVGKHLNINALGLKSVVRVAGLIEAVPPQSHLQNRIIFSADWFNSVGVDRFDSWNQQSFYTYIKLKNRDYTEGVPDKIREIEIQNFPDQNKEYLRYSLLPLTDIHLYSGDIQFLESTGNIQYVHIFTFAAIMILVIAGINYMNLSTALSLKRTREVGIKKAIGAGRYTLIIQFLTESFILSLIAVLLACIIIEIFLPEFNTITGKQLTLNYDFFFAGLLLSVTIVTSLLSGCYPALLLSSFSPARIIKDKLNIGSGSLLIRKGLVIFQFSLSTVIIICTFVIVSQLSFIRNSNPGYDKENIFSIRLLGDSNSKYGVLRNEFLKNKNVLNVSRSMSFDAMGRSTGISWRGKEADEEKHFWIFHSDFESASVFGFEMKEGRFFSPEFSTDSSYAFVINEAAARSMGLSDPLNEEINVWGKKGRIIGITRDFNFFSLHNVIEPLIFRVPAAGEEFYAYTNIFLRLKNFRPDEIISFTGSVWKETVPTTPFNYFYLDESLNALYKSELKMSKVFNYFSFISILIACLGLFGLASVSAECRRKEIGIRKVLGASTLNIALNLSKEFVLWVVLSIIISFPVAYYLMNEWLQDFAYRTDLSWWLFVPAGGITLLIALTTVSIRALKAASANPVDSLRYE